MMAMLPGEQKAVGPVLVLLEGDGGDGGATEEAGPPLLALQALVL